MGKDMESVSSWPRCGRETKALKSLFRVVWVRGNEVRETRVWEGEEMFGKLRFLFLEGGGFLFVL